MFPRCKKHMPSDSALRRLVIEAIVLVHNYQTELVGNNQIQTVFDPEYVWCENLQGGNMTARLIETGMIVMEGATQSDYHNRE